MQNDDKPSKSALKREHKAIQAFVLELLDESDSVLRQLPLSADIVEEIRHARDMKMGARKRQVGYISKRMAGEDVAGARDILSQLRRPAAKANDAFHRVEAVRDALISGDDAALETLVREHDADRGTLQRLVAEARRETAGNAPPRSARQLFRLVRSLLEKGGPGGK